MGILTEITQSGSLALFSQSKFESRGTRGTPAINTDNDNDLRTICIVVCSFGESTKVNFYMGGCSSKEPAVAEPSTASKTNPSGSSQGGHGQKSSSRQGKDQRGVAAEKEGANRSNDDNEGLGYTPAEPPPDNKVGSSVFVRVGVRLDLCFFMCIARVS